MARKYRLTLTEDHLWALLKATEFHERVAMGQFREIVQAVDPEHKLSRQSRDAAEMLLMVAKRFLLPDLRDDHAYWGIHSKEIHDDNRVLYDVLQVVRHRLAWDRHPEGGMTINFDEPRRTSERLDLIEVERLPEKSGKRKARKGKD